MKIPVPGLCRGDEEGFDVAGTQNLIQTADNLGFHAGDFVAHGGVVHRDAGAALGHAHQGGNGGEAGAYGIGPGFGQQFGGQGVLLQIEFAEQLAQQAFHAPLIAGCGQFATSAEEIGQGLVAGACAHTAHANGTLAHTIRHFLHVEALARARHGQGRAHGQLRFFLFASGHAETPEKAGSPETGLPH